ncbi:UPF0149 family protein [Psychromonas sp. MME2]|uniref:UPF0149 family protein n=1 Tax=unclassified Psychromonas TaxID=2614957 RepID=UPI00339C393F
MNSHQQLYPLLTALFEHQEIQENGRDLHEVIGFLYAITALPEEVELQLWLPMLWQQDKAFNFTSEALANEFATTILTAYQACLEQYQSQQPLALMMRDTWLDENKQITAAGMAFATGYLRAFQYAEEVWGQLSEESGAEFAQIVQTTMLLLSKMAHVKTEDVAMRELFMQLPSMHEIVDSLPMLLTAMGRFSGQGDCQQ